MVSTCIHQPNTMADGTSISIPFESLIIQEIQNGSMMYCCLRRHRVCRLRFQCVVWQISIRFFPFDRTFKNLELNVTSQKGNRAAPLHFSCLCAFVRTMDCLNCALYRWCVNSIKRISAVWIFSIWVNLSNAFELDWSKILHSKIFILIDNGNNLIVDIILQLQMCVRIR